MYHHDHEYSKQPTGVLIHSCGPLKDQNDKSKPLDHDLIRSRLVKFGPILIGFVVAIKTVVIYF